MPNGFEEFAQNAMALGKQIRENQQQRRLAAAMSTYDTDPSGAIKAVTAVDPITGYNMRRQQVADTQAATEARDAHMKDVLTTVTSFLKPAATDPNKTPQSLGAAFDSVMPIMSQGLGMDPGEIAQWKQAFIANPGIAGELDDKIRVVPAGGAIAQGTNIVGRNPMATRPLLVRRGDGGTDVINYDPNPASAPGQGTTPAPTSTRTSVDQAWNFTAPHEGGYAAHDANGAPVNFGINQSANPGVDVKNMTETQAKQIFNDKYFVPSGAANMPPALGVLHADTYYMNPKRAAQFLQESGGDPQKYLQLRAQWQDSLVKNNPKKFGKYADAWDSRNAALSQTISAAGGGSPQQSGPTSSSPQPIYSTPGKPDKAAGGFPRLLTSDDIAQLNAQGNHLDPNIQWQYDRFGQVQAVGGASSVKSAADRQKLVNSKDIINNNLDRMGAVVDGLLQSPGLDRATGDMSYFPSIRGGKAKDFENQLDSLKSQVMINVLNNLKAVSQNGSALGRVTNYEAQNLQRDIANLDLSNSPAQMRANLQKVLTFVSQLKDHYNRAYNIDLSGSGATQGGTKAPPKGAIDTLRSNPSPQRRQQFDQVFGNGSAKRFLGNSGGNNFSRLMPPGQTTPYGTRL